MLLSPGRKLRLGEGSLPEACGVPEVDGVCLVRLERRIVDAVQLLELLRLEAFLDGPLDDLAV